MNPTGELADRAREFRCRVEADAETIADARRGFGTWAAELTLGPEDRDDVVLATYEAMANSAEHAYRDQPAGGTVDVHATFVDNILTVTVSDHGTWKAPDQADTYRGRGLLMINGLADASAVTERPEGGTVITMTWRR